MGFCVYCYRTLGRYRAPSYSCLSVSKGEIAVGRGVAMSCILSLTPLSSYIIPSLHPVPPPVSPRLPCPPTQINTPPPAVPHHHPLTSLQPHPSILKRLPPLRKENSQGKTHSTSPLFQGGHSKRATSVVARGEECKAGFAH